MDYTTVSRPNDEAKLSSSAKQSRNATIRDAANLDNNDFLHDTIVEGPKQTPIPTNAADLCTRLYRNDAIREAADLTFEEFKEMMVRGGTSHL